MKKALKIVLGILLVPYLAIVIFLTVCLLHYNDYNVTEFKDKSYIIIDDKDLEPDYEKGSLVVVPKNKKQDVKVGDKIFFYDTYQKMITINLATVEKVEAITEDEYTYTVSGNHPISSEYFIGKASTSKTYQTVGSILSVLESRVGYLLIVVLPILVAFIFEIFTVIREMKHKGND